MKRMIPALVLALATSSGLVHAEPVSGESAFLAGFTGTWNASGMVRRNAESSGNNVTCKMNGSHDQLSASFSGTCRAMAVFTRTISAELKVDPNTGRYTGVYTGSAIGPAQLSGTRSGNVITLNVTWPKPVNGDTAATMVIRSLGADRFTFLVADRVAPGGPVETMSNLTLSRS
jgi:hypothetical protein